MKFKGHDEAWGEAKEHDYLEHRYQQPDRSPMDFTGDAKLAALAYELGAQAASQVKLVGWLPGDEFDVARKESQPWERKAPSAKGTSTA